MRWTDIKKGQEWRSKSTGRHCLVEHAPESQMGYVRVIHSTGRTTSLRTGTLLAQYVLRESVPPNDRTQATAAAQDDA